MLLWYNDKHITETIIRQFTRFLVILCILVCAHSTYIFEAIEVVLKMNSCACESEYEKSILRHKPNRVKSNESVTDISGVDLRTGNQHIVHKINTSNNSQNCTRRVNDPILALLLLCMIYDFEKKALKKKSVAINVYDRGIIKLWKIICYIHDRYDSKENYSLFYMESQRENKG